MRTGICLVTRVWQGVCREKNLGQHSTLHLKSKCDLRELGNFEQSKVAGHQLRPPATLALDVRSRDTESGRYHA